MRTSMADRHGAFIRFAQKVQFAGECWVWIGCRTEGGYGMFGDEYMRTVPAHRFSYEFFVGPIPKGLHIDHLCRNAACVNPNHLGAVTRQENRLRGINIVPCRHGARSRSHCAACRKEYMRDYMREYRLTTSTEGIRE